MTVTVGRTTTAVIGSRIDEMGTLIHDGGTFHLRRDVGGRHQLELRCEVVDLIGRRVRLVGTLVGTDLVSADAVMPIDAVSTSEARLPNVPHG